ncbi:hypothetical protein EGR_08409 [Echinococcus granulosus]|uniref:Uncharacterized protein n=1 Tax=Echinococcus granulosus TaxID=6210 RepID=W6U8G6_ECHGR|nr:hypothetical protein EGR_08409 [Echinococcus granulosus]EUB56681.1 hypothetical protein EGR_08409 [Echinococcus granulosus]
MTSRIGRMPATSTRATDARNHMDITIICNDGDDVFVFALKKLAFHRDRISFCSNGVRAYKSCSAFNFSLYFSKKYQSSLKRSNSDIPDVIYERRVLKYLPPEITEYAFFCCAKLISKKDHKNKSEKGKVRFLKIFIPTYHT